MISVLLELIKSNSNNFTWHSMIKIKEYEINNSKHKNPCTESKSDLHLHVFPVTCKPIQCINQSAHKSLLCLTRAYVNSLFIIVIFVTVKSSIRLPRSLVHSTDNKVTQRGEISGTDLFRASFYNSNLTRPQEEYVQCISRYTHHIFEGPISEKVQRHRHLAYSTKWG